MDGYQIITEALNSRVEFVLHKHNPRSGSEHYDLRFLDPKNPKLLHSFACPSNFMDTIGAKSTVVKTRDHDPRWLSLKSYRLETIDSGYAVIKIATPKYFEIVFKGKIINGVYKLFKLKTRRDDYWMLYKNN